MIKLLSFGIAVSLTLSVSIAVILQLQSIALRRRFENNILAEELARYLCTTPWNPPLTYGLAYSHNGIVEPYNLSMTAWNQLQTIDYEEYRALSNINYDFKLILHYWVSGHVDDPAYSPFIQYGSKLVPQTAGHVRVYVVITDHPRWMQGYLEVYAWLEG